MVADSSQIARYYQRSQKAAEGFRPSSHAKSMVTKPQSAKTGSGLVPKGPCTKQAVCEGKGRTTSVLGRVTLALLCWEGVLVVAR